MADIDATDLLPTERMRRGALDGEITQIHRGSAHAEVGDTFGIEGTTFEVTAVEERRLGDLTDADARAEGAADLAAYRERLHRVHEEFTWDDEAPVVRHRFEPVDGG
ncbi:MAG: ASCH domain-containing protein [Haloferacaceae archaeon]